MKNFFKVIFSLVIVGAEIIGVFLLLLQYGILSLNILMLCVSIVSGVIIICGVKIFFEALITNGQKQSAKLDRLDKCIIALFWCAAIGSFIMMILTNIFAYIGYKNNFTVMSYLLAVWGAFVIIVFAMFLFDVNECFFRKKYYSEIGEQFLEIENSTEEK